MSPYQITLTPAAFPLTPPLVTAHGVWHTRESLILRLTDAQGRCLMGEIAPLPWFGTETLAEARSFCERLQGQISLAAIDAIPDRLPCCQFGFGSAIANFAPSSTAEPRPPLRYCHLLPTGKKALTSIPKSLTAGCTVKWKIAVQPLAQEQAQLAQLLTTLPPGTRVRLDANGGLTFEQAVAWLTRLDRLNAEPINQCQIEFLEQPLPPRQVNELRALSQQFTTAIALDEAVCSLKQLQAWYDRGWKGFYILKAAIMGDPYKLDHWLTHHPIQAIFSTVFETAIGRRTVLALAQRWNALGYAVGMGNSSPGTNQPVSGVSPQWKESESVEP